MDKYSKNITDVYPRYIYVILQGYITVIKNRMCIYLTNIWESKLTVIFRAVILLLFPTIKTTQRTSLSIHRKEVNAMNPFWWIGREVRLEIEP